MTRSGVYQGFLACLVVVVHTMTPVTPPSPDSTVNPEGPWEQAAEAFTRWRTGDSRAIDDLVRQMSPVLWHVVRAYRLDEDVAEDVIQFTWLTLVRKADSIENPRAIASWLIITARRQAWRVSSRSRRDEPEDDEILGSRLPASSSAEAEAIDDDSNRTLWEAVRQLTERCQRLLRIVAFDDRPDYRAISEDLGMPVGSIGPTRRRCLEKLRDVITAQGADHV